MAGGRPEPGRSLLGIWNVIWLDAVPAGAPGLQAGVVRSAGRFSGAHRWLPFG